MTLASAVARFSDEKLQLELEEFRVRFEASYGETDLTKRYTSTLSEQEQIWIRKHYPKRYFDGLPLFVQAFIHAKMEAANLCGRLDDMPDDYVELYSRGLMSHPKR